MAMLYIFFVTFVVLLVNGFQTARAENTFPALLAGAALERTDHRVLYDSSYRKIAYPGGDVPDYLGVCSDVVIRAYRSVGIDLQRLVHEDMAQAFDAYPKIWGLARPDPNIDHRRVPNLRVFFSRQGKSLPVSDPRPRLPAGRYCHLEPA